MKILITISAINGWHGSVIHVKELSEDLVLKKNNVIVVTLKAEPLISYEFEKNGIKVMLINQLQDAYFDLIISYHFPLISYLLLNGINCKKLVLGSLSTLEPLETFPFFWREASLLTVMSNRAKEEHHNLYNIEKEKMYVLVNSAPLVFFNNYNYVSQRKLKNIAVVSNHIPFEIQELKRISNYNITFIGRNYSNIDAIKYDLCELVTPDLLKKYDLIISIGKTIQYSLSSGIPTYEYDRFGGCGYISPLNFMEEMKTNFSGRNLERKLSSKEILDEIVGNYDDACKNVPENNRLANKYFNLSNNVDDFLEKINESPDFQIDKIIKNKDDIALSLVHDKCFISEYDKHEIQIAMKNKEIEDLKETLNNLENNKILIFIKKIECLLNNIKKF